MTYDEAKQYTSLISHHGLTTNMLEWLRYKNSFGFTQVKYAAIYLAGSIVFMSDKEARGVRVYHRLDHFHPDARYMSHPIRFSVKHTRRERFKKTIGYKRSVLRSLGFSKVEIGTALLLHRMGVEPA